MRIILVAVALILVACTLSPPAQQSTLNQPLSPLRNRVVYLPMLTGPAAPTPTPPPAPPCFRDAGAWLFYQLLRNDPRQQRSRIECDPRLVAAAEQRAKAQPLDGLAHCDALKVCANVYARVAGCRLPFPAYGFNANNIESLTAGTLDPLEAFKSLARSPSHATHIFGQNEFFKAQDRIGIAVVDVPGHRYRWVWVVLLGNCGQGPSSGE